MSDKLQPSQGLYGSRPKRFGYVPHHAVSLGNVETSEGRAGGGAQMTFADTKKLIRVLKRENVKAELRELMKDLITYLEFIKVCERSYRNEEEMIYASKVDE
ncbi:hypothetical protein Dimus_014352 [Dionaea muscipula]